MGSPTVIFLPVFFLASIAFPNISFTHHIFHPPHLSPTIFFTHHIFHPPQLSSTIFFTHHIFHPPYLSPTIFFTHHIFHPPHLSPTIFFTHHIFHSTYFSPHLRARRGGGVFLVSLYLPTYLYNYTILYEGGGVNVSIQKSVVSSTGEGVPFSIQYLNLNYSYSSSLPLHCGEGGG